MNELNIYTCTVIAGAIARGNSEFRDYHAEFTLCRQMCSQRRLSSGVHYGSLHEERTLLYDAEEFAVYRVAWNHVVLELRMCCYPARRWWCRGRDGRLFKGRAEIIQKKHRLAVFGRQHTEPWKIWDLSWQTRKKTTFRQNWLRMGQKIQRLRLTSKAYRQDWRT